MLAIIIYQDNKEIDGGIYQDISYKTAAAEIGENNIMFYIPLTVSGKTYLDRKNDLRNKAIEYQMVKLEIYKHFSKITAGVMVYSRNLGKMQFVKGG